MSETHRLWKSLEGASYKLQHAASVAIEERDGSETPENVQRAKLLLDALVLVERAKEIR